MVDFLKENWHLKDANNNLRALVYYFLLIFAFSQLIPYTGNLLLFYIGILITIFPSIIIVNYYFNNYYKGYIINEKEVHYSDKGYKKFYSLLGLFIYFIGFDVAVNLINFFNPDLFDLIFYGNDKNPYIIFDFIYSIIIVILLIIIYFRDITEDTKEVLNNKFAFIMHVIFFMIIAGILLFLSTLLFLLFNSPTDGSNQGAIDDLLTYDLAWLYAIVIMFIGPIIEELVFRKAIFNLIDNKWIALIVSSFIFGFLHIHYLNEWYLIFIYGSMGLSFGLAYIFSNKNIYVPTAMHIINNTIATLF